MTDSIGLLLFFHKMSIFIHVMNYLTIYAEYFFINSFKTDIFLGNIHNG